jgi:hypothetical protein
MSNSPSTAPVVVASPFVMLGDAAAAVCEGDVCIIPDHHEQAVVNRALDEDLV